MLVIGRRVGEVVYVEHKGETLRVSVEQCNDKFNKLRLGFDGPKSFRILRDDAKQPERKDSRDA